MSAAAPPTSSQVPAKEERSSVESVKTEEVRFVAPDVEAEEERKTEAARRSSSRSETVKSELPSDLVDDSSESRKKSSADMPKGSAEDVVCVWAVLTEEKKPDSHDPLRRKGKYPVVAAVRADCTEERAKWEGRPLSSWVTRQPPE